MVDREFQGVKLTTKDGKVAKYSGPVQLDTNDRVASIEITNYPMPVDCNFEAITTLEEEE